MGNIMKSDTKLKYREYYNRFKEYRKAKIFLSEAQQRTAKDFSVTVRTVQSAISTFKPKRKKK